MNCKSNLSLQLLIYKYIIFYLKDCTFWLILSLDYMPLNQNFLKFKYLDIYAMCCVYKLKSNNQKLVPELNRLIYTYQGENKKLMNQKLELY